MSSKAALSHKKKVRGWRTQLRRVQHWRDGHLTPDGVQFERYGAGYVKLHLDPWDRLVARQPPIWLGREMVAGLLDSYQGWKSANPQAPYLRLWLAWPRLTDSQVVMAGPMQAESYEQMFTPVHEPLGFPAGFGPALLARLGGFGWQECLNAYPLDPEDAPPAWLARRPHRTVTLMSHQQLQFVQQGRIWTGQEKR